MISPELLRRYPFFIRLTDRCLTALAMLADETFYQAGVAIFEAGQPANIFYFLIEGGVDLLEKPFSPRSLSKRVRDILDRLPSPG